MIKKNGKKLLKLKIRMTEEKAIKIFGRHAVFVELNEEEGYYEMMGYKGLTPRKAFVNWANATYNLGLKE